MSTLRVPKPLPLNRCCYFELPATMTQRELMGYEAEYKRQYGPVFHSRIGNHFIFQLPSQLMRDRFLEGFELGCDEGGIITQKLTYYPKTIYPD